MTISEYAVVAAVKVLLDDPISENAGGNVNEREEACRAAALKVLQHAFPHLLNDAMAEAWDEGWEAGDDPDAHQNPYRPCK